MSRKRSEENNFKNILLAIALVVAIVSMARKAKKWLDKLDDDSFKWEQDLDKLKRSATEWTSNVARNVESGIEEVVDKVEEVKSEVIKEPEVNQPPISRNSTRLVEPNTVAANKDLTHRQQTILDLITDQGIATMPEISSTINGVTDRTLRRDLSKLEDLGLILKQGKTKNSVYKLK